MGRAPGDQPPWWRGAIRDVALLIVAAEILDWVVGRHDTHGVVHKHWPFLVAFAIPLYGLIWSIGRAYRVEPGRQTLSIAMLIMSLLGLLAVPAGYSWVVERLQK